VHSPENGYSLLTDPKKEKVLAAGMQDVLPKPLSTPNLESYEAIYF
jgi:CheY-like chemotaxis protein